MATTKFVLIPEGQPFPEANKEAGQFHIRGYTDAELIGRADGPPGKEKIVKGLLAQKGDLAIRVDHLNTHIFHVLRTKRIIKMVAAGSVIEFERQTNVTVYFRDCDMAVKVYLLSKGIEVEVI